MNKKNRDTGLCHWRVGIGLSIASTMLLTGCDDYPWQTKHNPAEDDTTTKKALVASQTPAKNNETANSSQKPRSSTFYPVNIQPTFNGNPEQVIIKYQDMRFNINPNNEHPILSRSINGNSTGIQLYVDFNYIYGYDMDDAMKDTHLFMSGKQGIVLLPSVTEEFPTYMVVNFDEKNFLSTAMLEIQQFDCDKFDKISLVKGKYNLYQGAKVCKSKTTDFTKLPIVQTNKSASTSTKPLSVQTKLREKQLPLPLTNSDFDKFYLEDMETPMQRMLHGFPFSFPEVAEAEHDMMSGSSDFGYYSLPDYGNYHVYLGYGAFEDESPKYVSEDNPDGAYVDIEIYLIVTDGKHISYQNLYEEFTIDKAYQAIKVKDEDGKPHVYMINNDGKIVEK